MNWHAVHSVHKISELAAQGRVALPEESQWFSGHFPGEPILPGIAQLTVVEEVVNLAFEGRYRLQSVERVRFKKVIRPGDAVSVEVWRKANDQKEFSFHLLHQGELACGGRAVFSFASGKSEISLR